MTSALHPLHPLQTWNLVHPFITSSMTELTTSSMKFHYFITSSVAELTSSSFKTSSSSLWRVQVVLEHNSLKVPLAPSRSNSRTCFAFWVVLGLHHFITSSVTDLKLTLSLHHFIRGRADDFIHEISWLHHFIPCRADDFIHDFSTSALQQCWAVPYCKPRLEGSSTAPVFGSKSELISFHHYRNTAPQVVNQRSN